MLMAENLGCGQKNKNQRTEKNYPINRKHVKDKRRDCDYKPAKCLYDGASGKAIKCKT